MENCILNLEKKFDSDRIICQHILVITQVNLKNHVLRKNAFQNKLMELIELNRYTLEGGNLKAI